MDPTVDGIVSRMPACALLTVLMNIQLWSDSLLTVLMNIQLRSDSLLTVLMNIQLSSCLHIGRKCVLHLIISMYTSIVQIGGWWSRSPFSSIVGMSRT